MRTKDEAHQERMAHGGLRYTFNDRDHYIGNAELEAIERSGGDNWERYCYDDSLPEPAPFVNELLIAAHFRPGKVLEGTRPAQAPTEAPPFAALELKTPGPIHWLKSRGMRFSYTACGKDGEKIAVRYGKRMFEAFIGHDRVCSGCVTEFQRLNP